MFSLSQPWKQCCVSYVGLPRKVLFKQVFVIRTHLKVHWVRSSLFLQLETSMGLLLSMQDDGGGGGGKMLPYPNVVELASQAQEEAIKFLLGGPRLPGPTFTPTLILLLCAYSILFGK